MSDFLAFTPPPDTTSSRNDGRRASRSGSGRRTQAEAAFLLVEIPPQHVVSGVKVTTGLMAPDVQPAGIFRELCPHCQDFPLRLVLRKDHVIRTHLFCEKCTRCFDMVSPDGSSAFTPEALPIY